MYSVAHVWHCSQMVTSVLCLFSGGQSAHTGRLPCPPVVHDTPPKETRHRPDHPSLNSKESLTSSPFTPLSIPHEHCKPWLPPHFLLLSEDKMEINVSLQQLVVRPSWVPLAHQLLLQIIMNKFLSK